MKVDDREAVPISVTGILYASCGTRNNLKHLLDVTGACRGVGIESSEQRVQQLWVNDAADPRPDLETAAIHWLAFASNSFDLVIGWSELHWVGREECLQAWAGWFG